jgi:PAS domain-containing protein
MGPFLFSLLVGLLAGLLAFFALSRQTVSSGAAAAFFKASPLPMGLLKADGEIVVSNEKLNELLGREADAVKGQRFVDFLSQPSRPDFASLRKSLKEELREAGSQPSPQRDLELELVRLDCCIEDSLELLAAAGAKKGLELAYLVDDETPNSLIGDVTHLR